MTAKEIDSHLRNHYKNAKYLVSNVYCFHSFYKETDFLVVNYNEYAIDIEVKVDFQDFKADFKKIHKHNILKNGYFQVPYKYGGKYEVNEPIHINNRPNRFYFCIPKTLQSKVEPLLPYYAGLLVVLESGEIKKIKEAKLLHKEKQMEKLEIKLCRKFYYSYLKQKNLL